MDTLVAIMIGALGSIVASVIIYYSSKTYHEHKLLQKYDFLKNISGKWYGLHYTNQGNSKHISTHEYELWFSGKEIRGTRKELGISLDDSEYEATTYLVEGKINEGVLMLYEVCKETREIGATLLNDFVFKDTFRGIYICNSDWNGSPIASPIVIKKEKKPKISDLEIYNENFNWCSWELKENLTSAST